MNPSLLLLPQEVEQVPIQVHFSIDLSYFVFEFYPNFVYHFFEQDKHIEYLLQYNDHNWDIVYYIFCVDVYTLHLYEWIRKLKFPMHTYMIFYADKVGLFF